MFCLVGLLLAISVSDVLSLEGVALQGYKNVQVIFDNILA